MGISQTLFGFGDGGAQVFATGGDPERRGLGELLAISLYVFGDDRQSCRDGVVHHASLARRDMK